MSGDLTPQLHMLLLLLLLYVKQQAEESLNKKIDNSQRGKDHNNNNKTREKRKCYFCGIVGHIVQDCRKKKMKMGACFQCGDIGHISKNCPKRQGQGPQAGPSGGTSLTSSPRCFVLSCLSSQSYLENEVEIFL